MDDVRTSSHGEPLLKSLVARKVFSVLRLKSTFPASNRPHRKAPLRGEGATRRATRKALRAYTHVPIPLLKPSQWGIPKDPEKSPPTEARDERGVRGGSGFKGGGRITSVLRQRLWAARAHTSATKLPKGDQRHQGLNYVCWKVAKCNNRISASFSLSLGVLGAPPPSSMKISSRPIGRNLHQGRRGSHVYQVRFDQSCSTGTAMNFEFRRGVGDDD